MGEISRYRDAIHAAASRELREGPLDAFWALGVAHGVTLALEVMGEVGREVATTLTEPLDQQLFAVYHRWITSEVEKLHDSTAD